MGFVDLHRIVFFHRDRDVDLSAGPTTVMAQLADRHHPGRASCAKRCQDVGRVTRGRQRHAQSPARPMRRSAELKPSSSSPANAALPSIAKSTSPPARRGVRASALSRNCIDAATSPAIPPEPLLPKNLIRSLRCSVLPISNAASAIAGMRRLELRAQTAIAQEAARRAAIQRPVAAVCSHRCGTARG